MYYLVTVEIYPGFTDRTILAASSEKQAFDTMKQLCSPFGYMPGEPRQIDSTEAAEMAKHTPIIKAVKTPRVRISSSSKATPAQPPEPLEPEQSREIASALEQMDSTAIADFLNYIYFLKALDEQPHITI